MKFVFEAKASDYDLAAEQEILLRHVSNRKRNWTRAVILCAATVVLCNLLVMFGQTGTKETLARIHLWRGRRGSKCTYWWSPHI